MYAKVVTVWQYAEHTVFIPHISLQKNHTTAVQKLLRLSVAALGIVSHPMECYDTGSFILPCCIMGRCFGAPVGGVRSDGCRKSHGLSEKRGDNLGFLGPCHSAPPGMMARAEGTCCEGKWRVPAQGREGNISTVLLASLMSPLYPFL